VGVAFITLALKGFMIPNKFLDGGIIGISILMHEITHLPFGIFVFSLNLPFLFFGKDCWENICHPKFDHFFIDSSRNDFVQIDAVTTDNLLIALFGGCLIGIEWFVYSKWFNSGWCGNSVLLTTRKLGLMSQK
jgi:uncharacterized membrane-anchored protein YitT (DUF2179 family)